MFRLYSKGCEYAIRAIAHIASEKESGRTSARRICRRSRVPEPFARKALQALASKGLLCAAPGPGGGYRLSRSAEKISVLELIKAVDGRNGFDACVMGSPVCASRSACALHSTWTKVKRRLLSELKSVTLRDLVHNKRLSQR